MLNLLLIPLIVILTAVLSVYELALTSVKLQHLQTLKQHNVRGAAAAVYMKQHIEATLSTLQLGMTLCSLLAGAMGGSEAGSSLEPWLQSIFHVNNSTASFVSLIVIVIPLSLFTITFGELVPKVFALKHNSIIESICLYFSPPLKVFAQIVRPITKLFEALVKLTLTVVEKIWKPKGGSSHEQAMALIQEIRTLASISRTEEILGRQEEKIILGATRLGSTSVKEVMVSGSDMCMMGKNSTVDELVNLAHKEGHKRFPIATNTTNANTVYGYIAARELFYFEKTHPHAQKIDKIIRPIATVPAETPLAPLLERMLEEDLHIMLVENQFNQITGLLTLEDILEELVGDIRNEFDHLPQHIHVRGNVYVVGGGVTLRRLVKETPIIIEDKVMTSEAGTWTVSEYILHKLDRPPLIFDKIPVDSTMFEISQVKRGQVKEAILIFPNNYLEKHQKERTQVAK